MVGVYDLRTADYEPTAWYSCTPREAVMAAYAQSRGDWNTWNYERDYSYLVRESDRGFNCGDFFCAK
jgi:hypothetical protein